MQMDLILIDRRIDVRIQDHCWWARMWRILWLRSTRAVLVVIVAVRPVIVRCIRRIYCVYVIGFVCRVTGTRAGRLMAGHEACGWVGGRVEICVMVFSRTKWLHV